jgi:uncharacterized protein (DUF2252 family)
MNSITERINTYNVNRYKEVLEYKYECMRENIFRFFRGSCHIFFEDLFNSNLEITSPAAWICGDLHLENFGSYKSDNRLVNFDLNDFDEAVLASVHWEIVRLATSIFVAFDYLKIEQKKAKRIAALLVDNYCATLKAGKALYIERQTAKGIVCEFLKKLKDKKQEDILNKKTIENGAKLFLKLKQYKHLPLKKELKKELIVHLQKWLGQDENSPYNYKVMDVAFRIAGTGSLGLLRYVFLLKSSNKNGEKYILLDMKETTPSSLEKYTDAVQPLWANNAERILFVQKLMQNNPPALLSTILFKEKYFIVQELQPEKDSIDFKLLRNRYRDMCRVIIDMGILTASSQLRSSGRKKSATADELIAFATREDWQEKTLQYASDYSVKIKSYYKDFVADNPKKPVKESSKKIKAVKINLEQK